MKRIIAMFVVGVMLIASASAQPNTSDKKLWKTAQKKAKEMTSAGWLVDGSMPLENLLFKHYQKLNEDGNQEVVGNVVGNTSVTTLNQGQQWAATMAAISYSKQAGQTIRGRLTAEVGAGLNGGPAADSFYEGYESFVEKEIKGELVRSFAVYRTKEDGGIEYSCYYIVNEDEAHQARIRAMQRAMEESEFARANAERISEFVREGNF